MLCISFKLFFEILIKQLCSIMTLQAQVVYRIQKYLWNPDKTTPFPNVLLLQPLCIAYKSIFEILIKQPYLGYT